MAEPASVPNLVPLRDALGDSAPLHELQRRLEESERRLDVVRSLLPGLLAHEVTAGGWDEAGWTLIVRTNAAAAKLRQWVPVIDETLARQGLKVNAIRVRILSVTER